MIDRDLDIERRFQAAIHGAKIAGDQGYRTPLRRLHDQITKRWRGQA